MKRCDEDVTDAKTLARTISCRWWDQSIERLRSIQFVANTLVVGSKVQAGAIHHHASYRLRPERKRLLPYPIRLDLELLSSRLLEASDAKRAREPQSTTYHGTDR